MPARGFRGSCQRAGRATRPVPCTRCRPRVTPRCGRPWCRAARPRCWQARQTMPSESPTRDAFHTRGVGHGGKGGVVGGQHGDFLAGLAHLRQAGQADGAALGRGRGRGSGVPGRTGGGGGLLMGGGGWLRIHASSAHWRGGGAMWIPAGLGACTAFILIAVCALWMGVMPNFSFNDCHHSRAVASTRPPWPLPGDETRP